MSSHRWRLFGSLTLASLVAIGVGLLLATGGAVGANGPTTVRVSLGSYFWEGNSNSYDPSISADGRYVAFASDATNLLSTGDTNARRDIFVRDSTNGTTERVSVSSGETEGNGSSDHPSISADGRYVAFESDATNLVSGDTNGYKDIFVHDRFHGATERVSVASDGTQGQGADFGSSEPSISADGRYVAFTSYSTNLVPTDTNGHRDVFVHDRTAGATERVSVSSGGAQGNEFSDHPSISADGRYVAFRSLASNLVSYDANDDCDIFVRDRVLGTTERASITWDSNQANGSSHSPSISADGRYVAFYSYASNMVPGDTNVRADVFVLDRVLSTTERVSMASGGAQGDSHSYFPRISADGRYVTFASDASNLAPGDANYGIDIFIRDRMLGTTEHISVGGNSDSSEPSISADGRYVAFQSSSSNLVPDDTNDANDVFVRDRGAAATPTPPAGTTERVSISFSDAQANDYSWRPSISADGRYVAFESNATNLVLNDFAMEDIFVRDRVAGTTRRVSQVSVITPGNGFSWRPSISDDGRYIAFLTGASNLAPPTDPLYPCSVVVLDGQSGAFECAGNGSIDAYPRISANGRYVTFEFGGAVFIRDLATGIAVCASVASDDTCTGGFDPGISADGYYIAFTSNATNLVPSDTNGVSDVFVRDLLLDTTERVSVSSGGAQGNEFSDHPSISADGRYVAFESWAANLVPNDTNLKGDIFVRDRVLGTTERVSLGYGGAQGYDRSEYPNISADGRFVAFHSWATNLVLSDTNGWGDIFVRDRALGTTERVSIASDGAETNDYIREEFSISADGRYIAFASGATNLAPGDTNGYPDVFVRDRGADAVAPIPTPTAIPTATPTATPTPRVGATERVSVSSSGAQASSGYSEQPSISADGRYVAFASKSNDLVPGDDDYRFSVFVRDRTLGATERVSVAPDGTAGNDDSQRPSVSDDGRYVAFYSEASNLVPYEFTAFSNILVRDRLTGANERVAYGDFPSISADGRYVAFESWDFDLVPGDTNGAYDIFVRDRVLSATERVSVSSYGAQADNASRFPSISDGGRYVAFYSDATNLVPDDTNGRDDVFVRDRVAGATERVSVSSYGAQADNASQFPSISADGRYVAFASYASNLVAGDGNDSGDIFVRDRVAGATERVSVASDGLQGDRHSTYPSISADGRYVAFHSLAHGLVPGDDNYCFDVFVRDRTLGTTERVSVASDGAEGNGDSNHPSISADGRYVAFASHASNLVPGDTNYNTDVFVRDRSATAAAATPTPSPTPTPATPTPTPTPSPTPTPTPLPTPVGGPSTERVSISTDGAQGNDFSQESYVSADGRYIAFRSAATNLVSGDTNGVWDIFVRDLLLGATERVSVAYDGSQASGGPSDYPSISADGRYVAFYSGATNLVPGDTNYWADIFVRDRVLGATERVSVSSDEAEGDNSSSRPSISADGRYVAFYSAATNLVPGDTNGVWDIFVRDRVLGTTERISVGSEANGHSYNPSISADGRYVVFYSAATNLVPSDTNSVWDVFVRDRVLGATERVSVSSSGAQVSGGHSYNHNPSISADGRYVAFYSAATNLVPSDTNGAYDVFVRDRVLGATERVSVSSSGAQASGGGSERASISADGRFVAFYSAATNLVPSDTNGWADIFVRDRVAGATERVSAAAYGAGANNASYWTGISADGRYVTFYSTATNLVPSDTNGVNDVFVHDRGAEAVGGAVAGAVNLQGHADDSDAIIAVGAYTGTTATSGVFTLTGVAWGTYTVTATMPGYLPAVRTGVAVSVGATTTLPAVTLLGGDADHDGDVDIYDLTLVGASLGTTSTAADINGDGVVNVFDLALVGANFGRAAPLPW